MNPRLNESINNPDKWTPNMGEPVSAQTLAGFQLGLNKIFGLGLDGTPNVRIVWGQDFEQTKVFNRYSGDWYPRYLSHVLEKTDQDANGQPVIQSRYVAAPRYVIEGRVSIPENALAFADSGVEKLVVLDPDGKPEVVSAESYRAAVGEQYEELLRILDHDHLDPRLSQCCQWNAEHGYECNGYYRSPDGGDLLYLQHGWTQMQRLFQTAPSQARTTQEKQFLFTQRMARLTETKRKQKEEIKKELGEFWKSRFADLDQSVTEQAHGPFHFLSGHNPAGVPVRQE